MIGLIILMTAIVLTILLIACRQRQRRSKRKRSYPNLVSIQWRGQNRDFFLLNEKGQRIYYCAIQDNIKGIEEFATYLSCEFYIRPISIKIMNPPDKKGKTGIYRVSFRDSEVVKLGQEYRP